MQKLKKSFSEFEIMVAKAVSRAMVEIAYDILQEAVIGCPYETGQLRNSGMAEFLIHGVGRRQILQVVGADDSGEFDIWISQRRINKFGKLMTIEISFGREIHRISRAGEPFAADLALWTHEELLPYPKMGKGAWYARKPGTGPKYLENAFNTFKEYIEEAILNAAIIIEQEYLSKHGELVRKGRR